MSGLLGRVSCFAFEPYRISVYSELKDVFQDLGLRV